MLTTITIDDIFTKLENSDKAIQLLDSELESLRTDVHRIMSDYKFELRRKQIQSKNDLSNIILNA